jgi:hypothetical protein
MNAASQGIIKTPMHAPETDDALDRRSFWLTSAGRDALLPWSVWSVRGNIGSHRYTFVQDCSVS